MAAARRVEFGYNPPAGDPTVRLAPGAGGRLTLRMRRYAERPTFAFPWA